MVGVIERYIEDVNQKREELKKVINENANLRETIVSLQQSQHDTSYEESHSGAKGSDAESDYRAGLTSPSLSSQSKRSIPSSRISSPVLSPSLSRSSSPPARHDLVQEIESLLDEDDSGTLPSLSPYSRQDRKNKSKRTTPLEVARREILLLR
jgi:hypothetical protein